MNPIEICLGRGDGISQRYYQYIPVAETMQSLFGHSSVQRQHAATLEGQTENDILADVLDGKMYKRITFFTSKPDSVKIILYQDAFEFVNPLGSAKRKHKIVTVYMTLADIFSHNRSNVDHMPLVLLCREADFKTFGRFQNL